MALLLLFILLVSCAWHSEWYRPEGATSAMTEQAKARCEIQAELYAEQLKATRSSATILGGGAGGGFGLGFIEGMHFNTDKDRFFRLCMNSLGWVQAR